MNRKGRKPRVKKTIILEEKKEVNIKVKPARNIIKLGNDEYVICPKCGWQHNVKETRCRFCGSKM